MPYRIKARSPEGNTVTRMDLDQTHGDINDKNVAMGLARAFAESQRGQGWTPIVEYYEQSIANPLWKDGAVTSNFAQRFKKVKPKDRRN